MTFHHNIELAESLKKEGKTFMHKPPQRIDMVETTPPEAKCTCLHTFELRGERECKKHPKTLEAERGIEEYNYPSSEHNGEQWIRIVDHTALTQQELQKAREEERERLIKDVHEILGEMGIDTDIHSLTIALTPDQSELDQPNK